ncbi:MAG: HAD family hydrolase [Candidatus Hodarchaeota archaeon]
MKLQCLVFDVDGTIVDNPKIIVRLFQEIVMEYLDKQMTPEEVMALWGPPGDEIFRKVFPPDIVNDAWQIFLQRYRESQPKTGFFTIDQIKELKKLVPFVTIFTGKSKYTLSISLDKLGMTEIFDLIVTGNDVERSKPYPDALFQIIGGFNLNKDATLFIGDSHLDIIAGKSAGVKTAAALWGAMEAQKLLDSNPDYVFKTPAEFLDFVFEQQRSE